MKTCKQGSGGLAMASLSMKFKVELDERMLQTITYLSERLQAAEAILNDIDFEDKYIDSDLRTMLNNWHYQVTRQDEFL